MNPHELRLQSTARPETRLNPESRIPSLDGIRAVAIGLVIVSHFSKDSGWGDPLDLGSLGVRIFFVISGFLITGLLLKELDKNGKINLPRFFFRRTLRIFPAFYFYIVCMLILASFGWADLSMRDAWAALTYTSNYSVSLHPAVAHTWSLATEEQFYLIWPAALFLAARRTRAIGVLLLLMLAATISSRILSHLLGHNVPAFFNTPIGVGCLLALTRERLRRIGVYSAWLKSWLGLLTPILIVLANIPSYHSEGARGAILSLVENIAIALWIDWAVSNSNTFSGRLLNTRLLVAVGIGSYSLYLWQQPFLGLMYEHPTLLLSGPWKAMSILPVRIAMIVACTSFSYFVVERPLMRLRGRIEPVLFGPQATPAERRAKASSPISGLGD
jgi:peptidoglycan/LPS O-acetylase OafA/YrhL